ncbi:uncharacterized protein MONBRDRAFT_35641 [Monosiga brevicollis MX1]|uniref:C3H1-type domain-containing protein n=1 Tax=Monosiga brevicollis TaxID=81824 RepID=A9UQF9_MONBE|nr:uncharacterized protein MONBRDRAFT_35641 [Monosiga brevicollis MX1]EDQ92592.1 predicted protein [Monosiga brevicollis MX1]|eukprot:XP_001742354.1 hypothetical protein [Monosiga brevicollis MX1]
MTTSIVAPNWLCKLLADAGVPDDDVFAPYIVQLIEDHANDEQHCQEAVQEALADVLEDHRPSDFETAARDATAAIFSQRKLRAWDNDPQLLQQGNLQPVRSRGSSISAAHSPLTNTPPDEAGAKSSFDAAVEAQQRYRLATSPASSGSLRTSSLGQVNTAASQLNIDAPTFMPSGPSPLSSPRMMEHVPMLGQFSLSPLDSQVTMNEAEPAPFSGPNELGSLLGSNGSLHPFPEDGAGYAPPGLRSSRTNAQVGVPNGFDLLAYQQARQEEGNGHPSDHGFAGGNDYQSMTSGYDGMASPSLDPMGFPPLAAGMAGHGHLAGPFNPQESAEFDPRGAQEFYATPADAANMSSGYPHSGGLDGYDDMAFALAQATGDQDQYYNMLAEEQGIGLDPLIEQLLDLLITQEDSDLNGLSQLEEDKLLLAFRTLLGKEDDAPADSKDPSRTARRTLCKFFQQGSCRRADCWYSHDPAEVPCKYFQRGWCVAGDACTFFHDRTNETLSNYMSWLRSVLTGGRATVEAVLGREDDSPDVQYGTLEHQQAFPSLHDDGEAGHGHVVTGWEPAGSNELVWDGAKQIGFTHLQQQFPTIWKDDIMEVWPGAMFCMRANHRQIKPPFRNLSLTLCTSPPPSSLMLSHCKCDVRYLHQRATIRL